MRYKTERYAAHRFLSFWDAQERSTLPGWALMIALATACYVLPDLVTRHIALGGNSPVEPVMLAIVVGTVLRNLGWVPVACDTGIKNYEVALKFGVVLLGLSLTFLQAIRLGAQAIAVVLLCLVTAPVLIYLIARRFGIAQKLSILIGVGTTICGSTAIAIAAPAIEAGDEDVSYAIGTITLFGILAMLTLPLAGTAIGMTDSEFGMWVGASVPATPQVIGAAWLYSKGALAQATVVKMTRNIFMIPTVFFLGVWYARQKASTPGGRLSGKECCKAVPTFLFGFLALAVLRSLVDHFQILPRHVWDQALGEAEWVAKFSILIAMAGIGLNTRLNALRKVGGTPLLVGLIGTSFLGAISYTLIRALGLR